METAGWVGRGYFFFLSGLVCAGSRVFLCVCRDCGTHNLCVGFRFFSPLSFCLAEPVALNVKGTGERVFLSGIFGFVVSVVYV